MNLLAIEKKRTVTKLKGDGFINVLGDEHVEYFDYQNRVTTSHFDSRNSVSSELPGKKIVGSMSITDILRDKRNTIIE